MFAYEHCVLVSESGLSTVVSVNLKVIRTTIDLSLVSEYCLIALHGCVAKQTFPYRYT